ncbi:oligosaccharyl transferase subunit Dad1 [Histoplasma capsulatum H143]|uniref:Dolichyl-diphosphooligosaccharide--protein glycosyltransferase subunit OST2 n=1 Tax=Ajellomyces capsulatus (strain H143) TaxID=544712 RepID=C6H9Y6_AJECH|nr:oligosaccharyl transferase subunit Dad1 [Histoplasma capsulatum H143]
MAPKRRVASSQPAANSSSPPTPSKTTLNPTSTQSHSAGASLSANSQTQDIVVGIWQRYLTQTPKRTLMLDSFMAFLLIPFNAFLSGFSAAVGQFVLTASLRMQTSHQGGKDGKPTSTSKSVSKPANGDLPSNGLSSERAFADYVFGSLILHFFCINFIN